MLVGRAPPLTTGSLSSQASLSCRYRQGTWQLKAQKAQHVCIATYGLHAWRVAVCASLRCLCRWVARGSGLRCVSGLWQGHVGAAGRGCGGCCELVACRRLLLQLFQLRLRREGTPARSAHAYWQCVGLLGYSPPRHKHTTASQALWGCMSALVPVNTTVTTLRSVTCSWPACMRTGNMSLRWATARLWHKHTAAIQALWLCMGTSVRICASHTNCDNIETRNIVGLHARALVT